MEVELGITEHAVNLRKRGGSLIVRIPPEVAKDLDLKDGQLALVLTSKSEKVVAYRFTPKKN